MESANAEVILTMSERPKVSLLKFEGINCDEETAWMFEKAGADTEIVLDTDLLSGEKDLKSTQIVAIAGGFSYGDDLGSGTVAGLLMDTRLGDAIREFQERGYMIGICNGFQILVKSGLLPLGTLGERAATLDKNNSGQFKSDTVFVQAMEPNKCVFLPGLGEYGPLEMQNSHAEGKFVTTVQTLEELERNGQVVFRYVDPATGAATQEYPWNPNGSPNAIAGITDPSGRILGLMPHTERRQTLLNHPNGRRFDEAFSPTGLVIATKMVSHANEGL